MPIICYGIKSLGVFGSYARGEARDTSDIDLLVEFSETPNIFKFMAIIQSNQSDTLILETLR